MQDKIGIPPAQYRKKTSKLFNAIKISKDKIFLPVLKMEIFFLI